MAARHFGAMKKAICALRHYYQYELPSMKALDVANRPNPVFPRQTGYMSRVDQMTRTFRYVSHLDSTKLIFRCHADDTDTDICVKFVPQYSERAHEKCASRGFAPALRGFQRLPGGWYMVVMDFLGPAYQDLHDSTVKASYSEELHNKIVYLHQAGFMHGDLRDTNIMVRRDGKPGIMLLDFDWAGVLGEVRYPMNVNTETVRQPAGAFEIIKAEHDIVMLAFMFE